jgi:site-specific DNA recombinase
LKNVAIYARVSSEQQAEAGTIKSQIEALRNQIITDGHILQPEMNFIDEGFSGATLVRPALEKLRDIAYLGNIDLLYILSPDRLSRKYAYQVLLIEEFQKHGVELIFLQHEQAKTPEGNLLLQMQGMIAEYERAKILERSRRGKLHAARQGSINVLGGAPYGYRYITATENTGNAQYEIDLSEAKIVKLMFEWIGRDRLTIGAIKRKLDSMKVPTKKGKIFWDRSVIWGILQNPAYIGKAAFGKTKSGKPIPSLRRIRGGKEISARNYSIYKVPKDEWIFIPVPPIISLKLYQTVQEQLEENRKRNRQQKRGASHLLQGLLVCKECGYAYYGKPVSNKSSKGKKRNYVYYRCIGSDAYRFGGQRVCSNKQVRSDFLEKAVWDDVYEFLTVPERIENEFGLRLSGKKKHSKWDSNDRLPKEIRKTKRGINKLIDAYTDELLDKEEFSTRIKKLKDRLESLTAELKNFEDEAAYEKDLHIIIGRMKEFAEKVIENMDNADWHKKREIIRSVVKCIEINTKEVHIVYRVNPYPFQNAPEKGYLQHCWKGRKPCTFKYLSALCAGLMVWKSNKTEM